MMEVIEQYRKLGYREVATDSGTGSHVLIRDVDGRVAKINQDPAYDSFVQFAKKCPGPHLPRFTEHSRPLGDFVEGSNDVYTVSEMELLEPLTADEARDVIAWVTVQFETLRKGEDLDRQIDPFNLRETFLALRDEAVRVRTSLDVNKSSNFMARVDQDSRVIVFSDPFNG